MSVDWIEKGHRVTVVSFWHDFSDTPDEFRSGYGVPVDEDDNVVNRHDPPGTPPRQYDIDLLAQLKTGVAPDGRRVYDMGIARSEHSYWEPGTLSCHRCKGEVVITMLMTNTCPNCLQCGQPRDFSWHGLTAEQCEAWMRDHTNGERGCERPSEHHEFQPCEADYSSTGQLLAPRSQWGWDTGESLSDILNSDVPLT